MQIRPATPADIPTLVAFRCRLTDSYSDTKAVDVPGYPERIAERLELLLVRDTHRFLIAEQDGRAVGCVSAAVDLTLPGPTWPGVSATLSDMWIEPDARGRGLARDLVDAACAWVREQGGTKVKLHSTPTAVGAYQRLGFHIAEAKPGDDAFPTMWMDFPE